MIATHKISGTRMRHIAERAGMSQGNLHYYFSTKEDLFRALLLRMLKGFLEGRRSDLEDPVRHPAETLAVFFRQEKEILEQRRETMYAFFDFWVQGTRDPDIREQIKGMYAAWRADIQKVVDRGVQQGAFSAAHASLVPWLMVALMDGAALQYLIDDGKMNLEAYLASGLGMVLRLLEPMSQQGSG